MHPALQRLVSQAIAGQRPTFASLTEQERLELTSTLVPQGRAFTDDERALFNAFSFALDADGIQQVNTFNAGPQPWKAALIEQQDGTFATPCDHITWCGEGNGFHPLQTLLWTSGIVPANPKESEAQPI
jgi:hypothetical protein